MDEKKSILWDIMNMSTTVFTHYRLVMDSHAVVVLYYYRYGPGFQNQCLICGCNSCLLFNVPFGS